MTKIKWTEIEKELDFELFLLKHYSYLYLITIMPKKDIKPHIEMLSDEFKFRVKEIIIDILDEKS